MTAPPSGASGVKAGAYASAAIMVLNLLLGMVALNLLAWVALTAIDWLKVRSGDAIPDNPWTLRQQVYPGWDKADIQALLKERNTWPPYAYEPMAQFKEHPGTGRFHTIGEHGFRLSGLDLPWPPDPARTNVFVFGGSTVLGWGLADGDTVPAHLQRQIDPGGTGVAVYNFAQSYYFSTHELLLFQEQLMRGYRPDVAIFVDGLNDFFHHDTFLFMSDAIGQAMAGQTVTTGQALKRVLLDQPMVRLGNAVMARLGGRAKPVAQQADDSVRRLFQEGMGQRADSVIDRYLRNKALIETLGRHYGVRTLFVWQPVPTYKYDLESHLFRREGMEPHAGSGSGYERAAARRAEFGKEFVWCADIQDGRKEALYVDAVHYTAAFSADVARCIRDGAGALLPR
ncbi:MAG: SGNH/GDSL hydrolase family protein [Magnetospirillum sp.]|nr:SGNH/GDSL hydrolase family protein [Magnetospirillum sp.]